MHNEEHRSTKHSGRAGNYTERRRPLSSSPAYFDAMKRPIEVPKEPMEASKMLYNLARVKPTLLKMQESGKAYAPLIGVIQGIEPEGKTPTAKAIQQQLGISATVYRRWLDALYMDFVALIAADVDALQFTNVEHMLYLEGQGEGIEVKCRLAVTPRVGEEVELRFLSAYTSDSTFYVTHITHEYLQDKVVIHMALRAGYYDAYFSHLLSRANFENRWPREAWKMRDYEQKELLRKLYPKG
jgi:hypothetical protein